MMNDNTPLPKDISEILGANESARHRWVGFWVIAGLLILAGAAGWFVLGYGDRTQSVRYVTAPVTRGDLQITVAATGNLEPTNQVEISSELSGIIREVLVDHNDRVTEGQPLARLATEKLEAEVAHAKANLEAARARVRQAEATLFEANQNFERYRHLSEDQVASKQRFEEANAVYQRASAALESAKADVAVAEATLALRQTDLERACICSPINGIVLRRQVEPGQTVAASLQAPVLFTIAENLGAMELHVDIDEADVSQVVEGQTATFTVDTYPDRWFTATVDKVRFAPERSEGVVTYKAQLTVDNNDLLLRPGMTATTEILIKTVNNALLVPNEALRFIPPPQVEDGGRGLVATLLPRPRHRTANDRTAAAGNGAKGQVWIVVDDAPAALPVTTGASDGRRTAIVDGNLSEGQQLITDMIEEGS